MKRISAEKARDYFQERVNTFTKSLKDMSDIVTAHPAKFTQEDVAKVQAFLMNQVTTQATAMGQAVTNKVGAAFSFDMDFVPVAAPKPSVPLTLVHATPRIEVSGDAAEVAAKIRQQARDQMKRTISGVQTRPKAVGRLWDSKEVVIEEVPVIPVRERVQLEPGEVPDNTGMIKESGFIEG